MSPDQETTCPGCGLVMPVSRRVVYDGYYHVTPECWSLYTEVLGTEFGNAFLYGQVHQLTVDSYALQHTGGRHPDKSIAVHLVGLYLVLEHGVGPPCASRLLQSLAESVSEWPHFPPPDVSLETTVEDIALADSDLAHIEMVERWARQTWDAWSPHHPGVADLAAGVAATVR